METQFSKDQLVSVKAEFRHHFSAPRTVYQIVDPETSLEGEVLVRVSKGKLRIPPVNSIPEAWLEPAV